MNKIVILTGSNLGNPEIMLSSAAKELSNNFGLSLVNSPMVSSPPWGFNHPNDFLNQVLVFETTKSALECLQICLETEKKLGRTRGVNPGYSARLIDIDILFYNSEIIKTEELCIPHPKIHERRFTLFPLSLVIPEFVHPVLNKSISELLKECIDESIVKLKSCS
ncbi:MAG: 2-amino-4-hydroxy-6-hydroxymethyldihydropteridine diphosphokinase [Bacteroidales bacterium]|nr:2-amino-4-hydroxy-6-hydroxymethyldihydropteridine diphosphokinase [Bacteroidales bacterium]